MMKLLMSWDMKPGKETVYSEFFLKEFLPAIAKLGIQPTEVWYTVFGGGPQILTGGVTNDLETMIRILESDEWHKLKEKLLTFVTNYHHKVVAATGRFQL